MSRVAADRATPSKRTASADRIRVCLVCESFHPAYAGAAIRFRRYAPGLRNRGVDLEVFCGTPTSIKARMVGATNTWSGHPAGSLLPAESLEGLPLQRVRLPDEKSARRSFLFTWALRGHLRRAAQRPQVVQILALPPFGVPGMLGVRRLGVPIVYTGTLVSELPEGGLRRAAARRIRAAPLLVADRVVASSRVMQSHFLQLNVTRPVEVIGNGVDLRRFRPPRDRGERRRVRRALGIGDHEPLALFVGSVTPRKGVDLLLEAWSLLPPIVPAPHLVVVGPRRDREDPAQRRFHRRIEAQVRASGAADRIHFVDFAAEVEEYFCAADLFVFPSRREGMGNTVLEAMAAGLPVVLTPYVGLPAELGEAGESHLLVPSTPEGLAGGLTRLLSDEDLRGGMGIAAREWARRHHDVEVSLDRYAGLYRRLAAVGPTVRS